MNLKGAVARVKALLGKYRIRYHLPATMPDRDHDGMASYMAQYFIAFFTPVFALVGGIFKFASLSWMPGHKLIPNLGDPIIPDVSLVMDVGSYVHTMVGIDFCKTQSAPNILQKARVLLLYCVSLLTSKIVAQGMAFELRPGNSHYPCFLERRPSKQAEHQVSVPLDGKGHRSQETILQTR